MGHLIIRVWFILLIANVAHRSMRCLAPATLIGKPFRTIDPVLLVMLVLLCSHRTFICGGDMFCVSDPVVGRLLEDLQVKKPSGTTPPPSPQGKGTPTPERRSAPNDLPYDWMRE